MGGWLALQPGVDKRDVERIPIEWPEMELHEIAVPVLGREICELSTTFSIADHWKWHH